MNIETSHRAICLGAAGSGKSHLARRLLDGSNRLVVLDPGGDPTMLRNWRLTLWNGDPKNRAWQQLRDGGPGRLYVPPAPKGQNAVYWEWFFDRITLLTHCDIEIDELYGVGPTTGAEGIRILYTQGRKRDLRVVGCAQRPAWLPKFALTEAEHLFAFRLRDREDRRVAAGLLGLDGLLPRLEKYQFIYNNPEGNAPTPGRWNEAAGRLELDAPLYAAV